jgi:site-specific DNA recombinase
MTLLHISVVICLLMIRVGVYVRISDDRTGQRAGVTRQTDDCLGLAERRGWQVVEVYEDNDLSAYGGKPRPGYLRMLEDIKAGRLEGVVVWHLDRLHRHPKELEEFFEVCDAAGVRALASVTGDVDLGSDDGRFHARILGAVARKESDDKSRRIRRQREELARSGRAGGGGTRPFGFEADRVTVREGEAWLIREAARRVLAGESLLGVCRDWQTWGVETPAGGHWRSSTLKRMLISPRVAGLREHRGAVVAEAEWPAIVEPDAYQRLRVILTDPARSKFRGDGVRRYVLSGIAFCGLCGNRLYARPRGDGRRCYVCASGPNFGGCGKIRALADPLEEHVAEAMFAALDTPLLTRAIRAQDDADDDTAQLLGQLRVDEEALEQAARDHYADRLIGRAEYLAARQALEARIEDTRRRLRTHQRRSVLADIPTGGEQVRAAWAGRDVRWRRALIGAIVDRIQVNPATRGRNRFDPARIVIIWRA